MEIEDYRKQFIDEIRNDASLEGSDLESYFIERVLTDLEDIGELSDPIPMSIEIRNTRRQILAFDGYSYDEADGALVLIISEFTNQRDSAPTLTNTRIEELLSYMQRFIEEAVNGNIRNFCDDSDPAVNIASEFKKKIGKGMTATEILRFKFIIIYKAFRCTSVPSRGGVCSGESAKTGDSFHSLQEHIIPILYNVVKGVLRLFYFVGLISIH